MGQICLLGLPKKAKICIYSLKRIRLIWVLYRGIKKGGHLNCYVGIGLAYNGSYTRVVGSNVGDIYGCALVFPAINELKKLPFYFCTQNGNRINGNTYLLKEDGDSFRPFIKIRSCSVEVNYGNDLENKPFCYDITKNI
ncbi:unnamed protein product [Meloidogyne enterolobii]|uniref:Uncharacterized protein n=1 Tax=Meloidogyne enterolobii TaxID=390850 RepID=A0ACB0XV51_MELEN